MRRWVSKFKFLFNCSLVTLPALVLANPPVQDEHQLVSSHRQGVPVPDSVLYRPENYHTSDHFYREYFGKSDNKIRQNYLSRWEYNDSQKGWNLIQGPDRYFSFGSLDNYRNQRDEPLRKEFATQALRLRLDEALNVQLRKFTVRTINRAQHSIKNVIDKIQNVPISLGKPTPENPKSQPGELRIGYDVLSDHSKIEYIKGLVDIGMYHPNFVAALMGTKDKLSLISMSLSSNFSSEYPKTTLSYPLNLSSINATLTKPLSPTVDSALMSSYPLRDPSGISRVEVRLSYRF